MKVLTGGHRVDVIDEDCPFRPCYALGFDKGSFTPGVGYTSYHPGGPLPVCWTRHLNGCPHAGVTPTCGDCHQAVGTPVMEGDPRELPPACPHCGGTDLYWLADVHLAPAPCCDNPDVPVSRSGRTPFSQKCRSCGTRLRGARLELARAAK